MWDKYKRTILTKIEIFYIIGIYEKKLWQINARTNK